MAVIAIFNQKGGVGKTTTCANLAVALYQMQRTPIAIDLDSQSHLTLMLGLQGITGASSIASFFREEKTLAEITQTAANGLQVIPSHLELAKIDALYGGQKNAATRLRAGLQASFPNNNEPILIDCCPMMGLLTMNAVLAADRILIPVAADFLSMQGWNRLNAALQALENTLQRPFPRKVVVTRFNGRRSLSRKIYEQLSALLGNDLCQTCIRENASLAQSPGFGMDIFSYAPNSHGAEDYCQLAVELQAEGFFD